MKKILLVITVLGSGLILFSLVMPFVDIYLLASPSTAIIGGADWPTYGFVFTQKYLWLTGVGVISFLCGLTGIMLPKLRSN